MSQQQVGKPLFSLLIHICFGLFFLPWTARAEPAPCVSDTLLPGDIVHRSPRATVERDCFRIPVNGSGILEIYGSTGLRSERVRFAIAGEGASILRQRYRTPREWIVETVGAAEITLMVEAEMPGQPVPDYAFLTQFTESGAGDGSRLLDGLTKDVDPWDDDGTSGFAGGTTLPRGHAKDVDPWDDDGTSGFAGGTTVGQALGLCSQGNGNRPACARTISSQPGGFGQVFGEIETGGEHHLTFALDHQQTVVLTLASVPPAGMQLFDSRGHALETSSSGLLVRTLSAGQYYVLVAGAEPDSLESTSYALRLDRLP